MKPRPWTAARSMVLAAACTFGALGGCVLIYHPGDYVTGGGGSAGSSSGTGGSGLHGGTGGTSATSSTTTATTTGSVTTSSTTSGDAGTDLTICEAHPDGGPCLPQPTWEWAPVDPTFGAVLGVAIHTSAANQFLDTDLVGAYQGKLTAMDGGAPLPITDGSMAGFLTQISLAGGTTVLVGPNQPSTMSAVAYRDKSGDLAVIGERHTANAPTSEAVLWTLAGGSTTLQSTGITQAGSTIVPGVGQGLVVDPADDTKAFGVGVLTAGNGSGGTLRCGAAEFPPWPLQTSLFAAQYDLTSPGSCGPLALFPAAGGAEVDALAVLPSGPLVIGGAYTTSAPFVTSAWMATPAGSGTNGFVAAISNGLVPQWAVPFNADATGSSVVRAIAVGSSAVYVVGEYSAALRFTDSSHDLTSAGARDGFLARIDLTGGAKVAWTRRIGGSDDDVAQTVVVVPGTPDTVYVGGWTMNGVRADLSTTPAGHTLCPAGGMFLLRLDADSSGATTRVARCLGSTEDRTDVVRLATDGAHLVIAGGRRGGIDLGGGWKTVQGPFAALYSQLP